MAPEALRDEHAQNRHDPNHVAPALGPNRATLDATRSKAWGQGGHPPKA